jgi:zinc transport system substrate-binding protein
MIVMRALSFLQPPARSSSTRGLGLAAAAVATSLVLAGCGSADGTGSADTADDGPQVVTAFYPLEFVTERVAGDRASIETLTDPGTDPHDLELTVRQTAAISDADLVFYLEGLQPAIDQAVEQSAPDTSFDAPVERRSFDHQEEHEDEHEDEHGHDDDHAEDEHGHDDEHGHEDEHADDTDDDHGHDDDHADEHDHGSEDPHVWLDPMNMAAIAEDVATRLAEVDPEGAEEYEANAADLIDELEDLDAAYTDGLASCERDEVVVSHDAFAYLSKYGLRFEAISGLSPDAEPSPARLAELADHIDESGITTVFTETLASPRLSQTLADELGLETAVLDPVEGLTDQTADEDYLSLMEANLAALQQANGCA